MCLIIVMSLIVLLLMHVGGESPFTSTAESLKFCSIK